MEDAADRRDDRPSFDCAVEKSQNIAWVDSVDRAVLLQLPFSNSTTPIALDGTALATWRLTVGAKTIDEIVSDLAAMYETEPESIQGDVSRFIEDMTVRGFFTKVRPAAGS